MEITADTPEAVAGHQSRLFSMGGVGTGLLLALISLISWIRIGPVTPSPWEPEPLWPDSAGQICLILGSVSIAVVVVSLFLSGRRRAMWLVALAIPVVAPLSVLVRSVGFGYSITHELEWGLISLAWIFNRRLIRERHTRFLDLARFGLIGAASWAGLLNLANLMPSISQISHAVVNSPGAPTILAWAALLAAQCVLPALAVLLWLSHVGAGKKKLRGLIDCIVLLAAGAWLGAAILWLIGDHQARGQRAALVSAATACGLFWGTLGLYEWLLLIPRNRPVPGVVVESRYSARGTRCARPVDSRYFQRLLATLSAALAAGVIAMYIWMRQINAGSGFGSAANNAGALDPNVLNCIYILFVCIALAALCVAVSFQGRRRCVPIVVLAISGVVLHSWGLYPRHPALAAQDVLDVARIWFPLSLLWLFNRTQTGRGQIKNSTIYPIVTAGALLAVSVDIFASEIHGLAEIPSRLAQTPAPLVVSHYAGPVLHGFFGAIAAVLFFVDRFSGGRSSLPAKIDLSLYLSLTGMLLYYIGGTDLFNLRGTQEALPILAGMLCWILGTTVL